jgi:creatinine amidohydrolase
MLWGEQSWTRIAELDHGLPVVIPLGSCEQHGPHLPTFVDTCQVEALARRLDEALGDRVLITPTLWLGSSHHHLDFGGTLSVRPSLYAEVIQELVRCVIRQGFSRVLPVRHALADLIADDDQAEGSTLAYASWWSVGKEAIEGLAEQMQTSSITHACEYETSLMLYLHPRLVNVEKACDPEPTTENEWRRRCLDGKVEVFCRFHRLTAPGGLGCPSAATADKGKALFDAVAEAVIEFVGDFSNWEQMPIVGPKPTPP